MENDTISVQVADDCLVSLLSSHILKEIPLKSGDKKSGKKKQIKYQQEQVHAVQNFILLWNLISLIRKGS